MFKTLNELLTFNFKISINSCLHGLVAKQISNDSCWFSGKRFVTITLKICEVSSLISYMCKQLYRSYDNLIKEKNFTLFVSMCCELNPID